MMPQAAMGTGYRRNGKQQACEPCRKGKLACDHGSPFCGRCVRRKTTIKCIYHPAPMTKARPPRSPTVPRSVETSSFASSAPVSEPAVPSYGPIQQRLPPIETIARPFERNRSYEFSSLQQTHHQFRDYIAPKLPHVDHWKTAVYPQSARYHGPTNFSTIFAEDENKDSNEVLKIGDGFRKHPGAWVLGQPLLGRYRPNAPDVRRKEVVKALWNIPSREVCEALLNKSSEIHDLVISPVMVKHCLETLWTTFGAELVTPLSGDNLAVIADVLFKNEECPLTTSSEDGLEWLDTFMGSNIRLEMMGLLFCFFGRTYLSLQDWDPLFEVEDNCGRNRRETAWRMTECADVCRKMCHMSETVNELVAALTYRILVLESSVLGDDSYAIGHRRGDMVTSAITAGLHRLPDHTLSSFTTASEYRRRVFSTIYYLDKTAACMDGTPPMLSRLYCDVKPCLDLSDEQLFSPRHELHASINTLSRDGWNTDRQIHSVSVHRAICQLSAVREEILELALGVNVLISENRIAEIHRRSQDVLDSLPEQLVYYAENKIPKPSTGREKYSQAKIMLDFLQNRFLLERVAMARGIPNTQSLLCTAMESLEITLMFWMMRDQLSGYIGLFDWIITFYGIPCAGIICVELLKKQTTPQPHSGFSRSDAIQKLTLFIGFLEWIRPTDGNYRLAGRLKKVVRNVLDHVLEPQVEEPPSTDNTQMYDPTLLEIDSLNDIDWLNTIDWTHGSWIGL